MNEIYQEIQKHPKFYVWIFGLINAVWIVTAYLFKLWHERQLKRLEQDLRYDSERRLKLFDLKATEYANYVANLDAFGKKNQTELMARMQPIFDKYLNDYLAASTEENEAKQREVLVWFSNQISHVMREGGEDFFKLKSESNRLKLIATDEMLSTFTALEELTEQSMNTANEFMGKLVEIIVHKQNDVQDAYLAKLTEISAQIKIEADNLMTQMRNEIRGI